MSFTIRVHGMSICVISDNFKNETRIVTLYGEARSLICLGTSVRCTRVKDKCNTPFTRYSRLSNRLYNRFDNRLYRVKANSITLAGSELVRS